MKRLLCCLVVVGFLILSATPALAWDATASGSARCDEETGEWVVTWTINNDPNEDEIATITESDRASVPVGSTIPAESSVSFTERLPGDSESPTLNIRVSWPSDENGSRASAVAELEGTCTPTPEPSPAPPPPDDPDPTPDPDPDPEPSPPPSDKPNEPEAPDRDEPTTPVEPPATSTGAELPVTGPTRVMLLSAALIGLVAIAAGVWLLRREGTA